MPVATKVRLSCFIDLADLSVEYLQLNTKKYNNIRHSDVMILTLERTLIELDFVIISTRFIVNE